VRDVLIGQTDYTVLVRITGTDGAPESGLAHTDIDIAYSRVETDNDVTTTDVAPADLANLTAAHSDWGWEEVSSGDHPGLYRLDIADAVFASGAWEAVVTITDASGSDFYAHDIGFRLVNIDPQASIYPANVTQLGSDTQSATDLKDFADAGYDPSTNKVQGVVLVDTTTANSDMRGTDNAGTAAELAKVPKSDSNVTWNATAAAQIQNEANDALVAFGPATASALTTHDGKLDTLTTTVGVAGAGLTEAGGDGDHLTAINLPNQTMDIVGNITGNLSGSVGSVTGAVGSVTGSVGSLATQAKVDVNAEVLDVLNVDTFAEPGQGAPAATASLVAKIGYLFKAWRNRSTQTSSEYALYADDATTKDQEAVVSDNGTTYERGEIGTGA
jgi:hypothetical protein